RPVHDQLHIIVSPEVWICRNPMDIDRRSAIIPLPDFRIAVSDRPDTGHLIVDRKLELTLFGNFPFNQVDIKLRPQVFWKFHFLKFRGKPIKSEDFRDILFGAVHYFHNLLALFNKIDRDVPFPIWTKLPKAKLMDGMEYFSIGTKRRFYFIAITIKTT